MLFTPFGRQAKEHECPGMSGTSSFFATVTTRKTQVGVDSRGIDRYKSDRIQIQMTAMFQFGSDNSSKPDPIGNKNNLTVRHTLSFRPGTRTIISNSNRALGATRTW